MTYHLKLPSFSNHQLNFAIRICYFYTKNQIYTSLSIITFFQLFLKKTIDDRSIKAIPY